MIHLPYLPCLQLKFKEQEMESISRQRNAAQRELDAERDKARKRQRASDR